MSDHLDGCSIDFRAHARDNDATRELLEALEARARVAPRGLTSLMATMSGRDLGLADRLRADGLQVVEVAGWQLRGDATLNPRGALTHHTAGPRATSTSRAPSLGIIINGRSDLSGPLANVYMDFDGKVYVVASGRANHAGIVDNGAVSWAPDGSGNSMVWGLEVEHPGTFPLEPERAVLAARVQAAVVRGTVGADRVIYHKEWAPSRKIDLATAPSPAEHRALVARFLADPHTTEDDTLKPWIIPGAKWYVRDRRAETRPDGMPDAPFDNDDFKAVVAFYAETHRAQGPPLAFDTWADQKAAGEAPGIEVPHLPMDRWWDGLERSNARTAAAVERASATQLAAVEELTRQLADAQERIAALEGGDNELAALRATVAAVREQLRNALAALDA